MQDDLDGLIPREILELLSDNEFNMSLGLTPFAVTGIYPKVKVSINDDIIFNGVVDQPEQIITYTSNIVDDIKIRIEYYDKPRVGGTIISTSGEILENQGIDISRFIINGVDLIKNRAICDLGYYYMLLDFEKLKYFQDHGINTEPSNSLVVRENGYWEINIQSPIMRTLSKLYFKHSNIVTKKNLITRDKLNDMYQTVLRIRDLEKKLKDNQK